MKKWILFVLVVALPCNAAVIRIPQDYPNVQAAVNVASDGDTLLIADGTYYGISNHLILINNLSLSIVSENGPENCVFDCFGEEGRFFRMIEGPERFIHFEGITFQNSANREGGTRSWGGGVFFGATANEEYDLGSFHNCH